FTAFVSFMGFATVQTIVAFIAQSEAMLGDSAAMGVDALTYGFNLYAEREKNKDRMDDENGANETDNVELTSSNMNQENSTENDDGNGGEETERQRLEQQFRKRRRHLHLELIPPLMSVTILIVVTVFVLRNSIHTLVLDAHRKQSEQSIPNLELMMAFSTTNLFIDVFNVTCFARAKHLMGYNTKEEPDTQQYGEVIDDGLYLGVNDDDSSNGSGSLEDDDHEYSEQAEAEEKVNLNMCSAYTHVFADTLRSIAVIIAAIIAYTSKIVTPEVADATAAVIVSAIILISLVPLFSGLVRTWRELRSIASEVKFLSSEESSNKEDTDVGKRQII
ncbi:hypothetical protein ACHAWC_001475, partial [Mediolabrus comicus]